MHTPLHLSLLVRPQGEPQGLYRLFLVGVLLTFSLGGLSAALVGIAQGLWNFKTTPKFKDSVLCQAQNEKRLNRERLLNERLLTSKARLAGLEKALTDQHDPAFVNARAAISVEENLQRTLERDLQAVSVESLAHFLPPVATGLLVVVLFAFVAARLAAHHGLLALGVWGRGEKSSDWQRPYWSWVTIIFLVHASREVYTSILSKEKSWFGWSSFCVSSEAWGLMLVTGLGVSMVIAYPATVLWQFGRRSNLPAALDMSHSDGQWGVGSYVLFLQTWSILSLVFWLLPAALWLRVLRDNPRFSIPYLLTGAVLFASTFVVSGRMVRNAITIRQSYQSELRTLGVTWQQIQEKKPPPDPTINFLGEHWWKLPAVVFAILAALWLIVELIGVAGLLLELTGFK